MTAATVYNSGVDGIMALVLFQILMVVAMAAVAVADKPYASTRVSVCTLLTHTHAHTRSSHKSKHSILSELLATFKLVSNAILPLVVIHHQLRLQFVPTVQYEYTKTVQRTTPKRR